MHNKQTQEMVPSMYHKCQRIVTAYSIYETIFFKKLDNTSQKRRKSCFPERGKKKKDHEVPRNDPERNPRRF